jgi:hypothetical protein
LLVLKERPEPVRKSVQCLKPGAELVWRAGARVDAHEAGAPEDDDVVVHRSTRQAAVVLEVFHRAQAAGHPAEQLEPDRVSQRLPDSKKVR